MLAAVHDLCTRDPYDELELDALEIAERNLSTLQSFVAAADMKLARRRRALAIAGQAAPVDGTRNRRRSAREQKQADLRDQTCDRLPTLESALANGDVATGHVDAIATATAGLTDEQRDVFDSHIDELTDTAKTEPVDDFKKRTAELARAVQADEGQSRLEGQRKRNNVKHWVNSETGMHHIHAELDPESGAKVITAIRATVTSLKHRKPAPTPKPPPTLVPDDDDTLAERIAATVAHIEHNLADAAARATTHDQLLVDAFIELITGARTTDRRVPEISVLIDWDTLLNGLHDTSRCETSSGELLAPETIRRLCCDGDILPIVLGGNSEVLDHGRAQRLASPAQRRALRAMYPTCVIPGCTTSFDDCEIHHTTEWTHGGNTDLDQLVPICTHHHHQIHEGHWTLTLAKDPERTITLRRPNGTIDYHGPSIQRTPTRQAA